MLFSLLSNHHSEALTLQGAFLFPSQRDNQGKTVFGGLYHPDLKKSHQQLKGNLFGFSAKPLVPQKRYKAMPAPTEALSGTHFYAGLFCGHFGHFLAESIHRLSYYSNVADQVDKVIIIRQGAPLKPVTFSAETHLSPWQKTVLDWFGIPLDKVLMVSKPLCVDHLIVPRQQSIYRHRGKPCPAYLDRLAALATQNLRALKDEDKPAIGRKLYISRKAYFQNGGIAGEGYLERYFEGQGYSVFRPEEHSLKAQLWAISQASDIIFCEGSAAHLFEMLGRVEATLLMITRRPHYKVRFNGLLTARAKRLDYFPHQATLPGLFLHLTTQFIGTTDISTLDAKALKAHLSQTPHLQSNAFDVDAFYKEEASDLHRYLSDSQDESRNPASTHPDYTTRRDKFLNQLKGLPNPYL